MGQTHPTAKEVIDKNGGIGSLAGKTAIVTGGNSGIGLETCKALAYGGAKVILGSRSIKSGTDAIEKEIRAPGHGKYTVNGGSIVVKEIDLSSLASIKSFADDVNATEDKIDFLVLNAGIMAIPTLELTEAGFESQIGVNHFGHFYLTKLLLPKMLQQQTKSRVVAVSSKAHVMGDIDLNDLHFQKGRSYGPWPAYGQSKLANILFVKELADRCKGTNVTALALHPGVIQTNLLRNYIPDTSVLSYIVKPLTFLIMDKTIPQGAATTVWGCVAPELESKSGEYLDNCKIGAPNARGQDAEGTLRKQFWEESERQIAAAVGK